jgi:hypothetical protein
LVVQCGLTLLIFCAFLSPSSSINYRPEGDVGYGPSLAVSVAAGSLLQTFNLQLDECALYERSRWWDMAGVVAKGLLLVLLGVAGNTAFYHFMYDKPNSVPIELFFFYGLLLLFASMQTASAWFGKLREVLGRQAQWRLVVRIQHIICALILAAAWFYPLQLHGLRVMILVILMALNAFHKLFF